MGNQIIVHTPRKPRTLNHDALIRLILKLNDSTSL
jgi:hypothetical protein